MPKIDIIFSNNYHLQLRYINTVSWIGGNVAVHMRKVDNPECKVISLIVDADISINLLVVYRESVNLIGYITRRLSADSHQL